MADSILPPSFSGPIVDPDHPWLGLHPFAEENHRYFFGRTAEVRDIFLRVRENPLTVLYGQSGLGKTSLLRAGLTPKLRVERFRPVRVLLDFVEKSVPLVDQVRTALAAACADPGGDVANLIESWAPLASLWEICAHETIRPRDLADKPPVLIIDQLEEVFTLAEQQAPAAGSRGAEVAELFAQIGDLVENRAPVALQKTFKRDPRLALAYDSSPTAVRVVLSLREDYLAQLEQWKSTIPSLMRNRMPLRLLTGPHAFEAVVRPGRIDRRKLISDRVGEQIVRFVAKRPDDIPLEEIEAVPPLLSLVCERLNTARLEAKPPQEEISDELVKSQGTDILQRFYDESFAAFPDAQREVVREYVEDRMVTVGGHRNPVAREDAVAELARQGVSEPDNVLNALIARRLLTAERRGGIQRLEITHDVLTPLAIRGRKERQERLEKESLEHRAKEEIKRAALEAAKREQETARQRERETAENLARTVNNLQNELRQSEASRKQAWEQLKNIRRVLEVLFDRKIEQAEPPSLEREGSLLVTALVREFRVQLNDVATAINNLALLLRDTNRLAEAEPLFRRALAIDEKIFGPEHPDVATSLNNLGELYQAQGQYAKAEPLFQRALAIREKVLGPQPQRSSATPQNPRPICEG